MARNGHEFSATQRRILTLLSDGCAHNKKEIHNCLSDELSRIQAIQWHISKMREILRPRGEDIICEFNLSRGGYLYRHVRLLSSRNDD